MSSRIIDAPSSSFAIQYREHAGDDTLRMTLLGELDLAVAGILRDHLRELMCLGVRVRLDLSRLRFMDCSGVNAIAAALEDANRSGWELQVDRRVTASVERMIRLAEVADVLWPCDAAAEGDHPRLASSRRPYPESRLPATPVAL